MPNTKPSLDYSRLAKMYERECIDILGTQTYDYRAAMGAAFDQPISIKFMQGITDLVPRHAEALE